MFEDFNTLILLVGENPLINVVTTEYFLTINTSLKTVVLVHSEVNFRNKSNTKKYADNIEHLLKSRHGDKLSIEKVHLSDVSNAERIFLDLKRQLGDILIPSSLVRLDYTGGTKTMGVHVYRWLERYAESHDIRVSFSYLDARNFYIIGDGGEVSEDLRERVSLNIEEIIALHGFNKRKNNSKNKNNIEVVEKLREIIKDRINDYLSSTDWEIEAKPSKYEFDYEFMIDAILVNGFQLIGIRYVSSDDETLCKGKGFEILARTRQIGGQGSRAILVTNLKEQQKVKLQLEFEAETDGNILVLNDLDQSLIEDFIDN